MTDQRPDPDELLNQLKRDEAVAQRGRLKIFFGACAGVGKTYAMLSAAQERVAAGGKVVAGVVETHGRKETEEKLVGLELLPLKEIDYKGHKLKEFDLDAALALKPPLILIDEFAHSNVPGSRHPKRWQDVDELLAAGIDVYTTLNVQHLESLNDVVGQITGIVVRETLPDKVFDSAEEVALVDLPPEELIGRLHAGKVYIAHQAKRAVDNFFRKGNLLALRELALRRTADRVDAQMRAYRADQEIKPVWQARERLLICLGPAPGGEKLVRSAKRMAANLDADWIVAYVETPALQRLSKAKRDHILKVLKLAQELGAETSVLAGADLAETVEAYAVTRNVSKLVLGKSPRSRWSQMMRPTLVDELSRRHSEFDIYVVGGDVNVEEEEEGKSRFRSAGGLYEEHEAQEKKRVGYLAALAVTAATTALAAVLVPLLDLSNIIMIYLMVVVGIAVRFGRGPGVMASFLSVAVFDFFFVPPRMSFTVSDTQYLLTFIVMLTVALTISQLTARMSFSVRIATQRERRTRSLYDLGRELAGALTAQQILDIGTSHVEALFQARCEMLIPNSQEQVRAAGEGGIADAGVAQWVYDHQQPAGLGTDTLPSNAALYVPLKAPMRTRGVLALVPPDPHQVFIPEQQRLLETCAAQIALALERVHYVEVAQDAIVAMESERLRNSVLSAISHDLRTPLTTMVGLSTLLAQALPRERQLEVAHSIHDEALRMNNLVTNLLDMARLQSGVRLNKQWQLLDDVVGSALRSADTALAGHQLQVELSANLPLLAFDEVLIERVLVNLLQNAGKYTPPGSTIRLAADVSGSAVSISVCDDGPGVPAGLESRLFDKFTRGTSESPTPGVGLGLAICRSIVEAHGGVISAANREPHGACFTFTLPLGHPPRVPEE
ncbi:MAG: sensor histidine kinase KdpD [Paludibacterium sp.]|uniref:sensor histidine kinase n=1 Tax=Paludibacterium sp. TaxID=1917523 RepID=UPI0025E3E1C7|nr:sensor histidine kinase KdpD [Paludibacterium sp.]MBV8047717.1 sensor histidine kinase KdpD [Paludibacterium sp.]MBV8648298.1 sensor histidine kinase KdpD [Paludibacterium sp.]